MGKELYKAINVSLEDAIIDGKNVVRVRKPLENLEPDTDTYAELIGSDFHNGTIELDVYSLLQDGAPDYSRGFIGLTFRGNEQHSEFESFYVRPTNGRHPDPIRRSHASQYFSYPGYTFDYFRKYQITDFEAEVGMDLAEWIKIKAVIKDDQGTFYVNDMDTPVLVVDHMKHGPDARGTVGLYVDIGTDGYFGDLTIKYDD